MAETCQIGKEILSQTKDMLYILVIETLSGTFWKKKNYPGLQCWLIHDDTSS